MKKWCTNIYPVFVKMKEEEHLVYPEENLHLSKLDYCNLGDEKLNLKINRDIRYMLEETREDSKSYVILEKEEGMRLVDKKPDTPTCLLLVYFNDFKYLFLECEEKCILINYSKMDGSICYKGENFAWEYLPQEGTICYSHQYKKYLVNTYEAFCGFCRMLFGGELHKRHNNEFFDWIVRVHESINIQQEIPVYDIPCQMDGVRIDANFVRSEQMIIATGWNLSYS